MDNHSCANRLCPEKAGDTVLVTSGHVRRFCSVECIAEGQEAHYALIRNMSEEEVFRPPQPGVNGFVSADTMKVIRRALDI